MTNLQANIRAALAAGIVGVAFYAYSMQPGTITDRFSMLSDSEKESLWSNQWFGMPTWQSP